MFSKLAPKLQRTGAACALLVPLLLAGCDSASAPETAATAQERRPEVTPASAPARHDVITMYRDPNCGCCSLWGEIARKAGHEVRVTDHADMASVKQRYGVPLELASCHTSLVGGYVVEGHVPLEDVARLLRERPTDIAGIAVAGMPAGSPGMEMPDGTTQPFQVVAFDRQGRTHLYRQVSG